MKEPVRVKDVMTKRELESFYELNELVLTSTTSCERRYYNEEIMQLINNAKDRYFHYKELKLSDEAMDEFVEVSF